MPDTSVSYPPPDFIASNAYVDAATYDRDYRRSVNDPDAFWGEQARLLDWVKAPTRIRGGSFAPPYALTWFEDGVLNACHNCVDRHLPEYADAAALIWEGDDPSESRTLSYSELHAQVCRAANALKSRGVQKGDRVTIYLPMVPEAVVAMLACARIGAIHSVVFGGFSASALRDRIQDCESTFLITADEGLRAGKRIPLKANADAAVAECPDVKTVLVLQRTGGAVAWDGGRDVWWHDLVDGQSADCPCEPMNAEDPLFILYTSGSTGKPKGVLHTTAGYLLYAALTHRDCFDYKDGEVYWCTADVGWVTGHSYIVYGPLANRAASLMFEGVPTYPDASRLWQVVDKHKVNIFYTAPTAIRALLKEGDAFVAKTSRRSLRILGSVGEPINSEAWLWYYNVGGGGRCPIVDTWWQTETGGHMIVPLPGAMAGKPGSAGKPFFGVETVIVDNEGKMLEGAGEGNLCIKQPWPGMMRTLWRDHKRFVQTYFSTYDGLYFSGDGCRRDADGYYWITGRVDDVINVSGHRIGTAEIESAINQTAGIAESAVVGFPHPIKGQGIYAYVQVKLGVTADNILKKAIVSTVRRVIGPIATPDEIQWTQGLPKTRSGKIMRRILRKIAAGEKDNLGDISTLADPTVIDALFK